MSSNAAFRSQLSQVFVIFLVLFSCCFFVRFGVVLGCHFGAFWEAKSTQNATYVNRLCVCGCAGVFGAF